MQEITLQEAEMLLRDVKHYVKENKITRHGLKFDSWLVSKGFIYTALGTYPRRAGYKSMDILITTISSKKYLNGKYLIVGAASKGYRKGGNLYNGYVIKIKE